MGACGDTFARNHARIAILVLLSTGPMDPTAALRIGTRIRLRFGDPSLHRAAMPVRLTASEFLCRIGLGVTDGAPRPMPVSGSGPQAPAGQEPRKCAEQRPRDLIIN
jgi:hypothetical protein